MGFLFLLLSDVYCIHNPTIYKLQSHAYLGSLPQNPTNPINGAHYGVWSIKHLCKLDQQILYNLKLNRPANLSQLPLEPTAQSSRLTFIHK